MGNLHFFSSFFGASGPCPRFLCSAPALPSSSSLQAVFTTKPCTHVHLYFGLQIQVLGLGLEVLEWSWSWQGKGRREEEKGKEKCRYCLPYLTFHFYADHHYYFRLQTGNANNRISKSATYGLYFILFL